MAKPSAEDYSTSNSDSDSNDDIDPFRRPSTDPTANEFESFHSNPRKRRRTGRDTKECAALGIFGSESEDDTRSGGRQWKRKPLRMQGVSFVSSHKKVSEKDDAEGEKDEEDEEDEDIEMTGVGLGFQPATQGLGFGKVSPSRATAPAWAAATGIDAKHPLGNGFVPSSARDPVLRTGLNENKPDKPSISAKPSAFSSRNAGGQKPGFNSKSFGARMMAKMGYVAGEGLGKEGQGRNIIIEANLRPQGAGLGAVREKSAKERQEEKRQARLRGETVIDLDEEERRAKANTRKKDTSRNSGVSTPRRAKTKYMTMEEVRKSAPGLDIPDAFAPILDLTGPDRKMLTSSSGLMTPSIASGDAAAANEETAEQKASHKLARRAQTDFMSILEEWESLQNRKAYAKLQAQQLQQEMAELQDNLQGHQMMIQMFGKLLASTTRAEAKDTEPWQARWDRTIAQLKSADSTISEVSQAEMQDDLANIIVASILPLFKEAVAAWEPLLDPGIDLAKGMQTVQKLAAPHLQEPRQRRTPASPYETMFYKIWLSRVSDAVRKWDVDDPYSLLSVYETWEPLLPDFVRAQLLEQEIVRRLDEAVQKWEPKRRRHHAQALPHLWLFPWLPHLPPRLLDPAGADSLVADVKRKLRQLIHVWEFYRGEMPGLRQWRDMLCPHADNNQWRPLVLGHILPCMAAYLRAQFRIDPRDQASYLEVLTGEFQWLGRDLVSADMLGQVIVSEVFPMWHDALYRLLTTPGLVTLDQLCQWLQWWTAEVFPEPLRLLPAIASEFERGMTMVNKALDLGGDPVRVRAELLPPSTGRSSGGPESRDVSQQRHHHHRHNHREKAGPVATASAHVEDEMSIRHYVQDWCEINDLQFMPERKKVHVEGPLYRITARGDGKGGVLAYFKGLRLYVEAKKGHFEVRTDREEDWTRLLEMAQ